MMLKAALARATKRVRRWTLTQREMWNSEEYVSVAKVMRVQYTANVEQQPQRLQKLAGGSVQTERA